jgi:hypothetical protein
LGSRFPPAGLGERKRHGLDLEAKLGPMPAEGQIDVPAGDEVTAVLAPVERWAGPEERVSRAARPK